MESTLVIILTSQIQQRIAVKKFHFKIEVGITPTILNVYFRPINYVISKDYNKDRVPCHLFFTSQTPIKPLSVMVSCHQPNILSCSNLGLLKHSWMNFKYFIKPEKVVSKIACAFIWSRVQTFCWAS